MGAVAIAIVGVVLLASRPAPAATEVLVTTGDAAVDGARLDSISAPAAGGDTVIFFGGTSAVLTASGGAPTVVAKTGDPLPAPLDGTFNRLSDRVAISDGGVVAFAATLNSRRATDGVFMLDEGHLVPITDDATPVSGEVSDLNRQGDLLYRTGLSSWLWSRATHTAVQLVTRGTAAPGGGSFELFGVRPVLSDGGVVAFVAIVNGLPGRPRRNEAVGVFTVDGAGRVSTVLPLQETTRAAARRFVRRRVAINTAGAVAFTAVVGSVDGAFVWHPDQPPSPVARVGDVVGGMALRRIDPEYIGVDSTGRVAFEGVFDDGPRLVIASSGALAAVTGPLTGAADFGPRLTDSGRIAWVRDGAIETYDGERAQPAVTPDATPVGPGVTVASPRINDGGVVAFAARQDALYAWSRGAVTRIAAVGEAVGGTPITGFEDSRVVRGDTVAFFVSTPAADALLAARHGGAPLRVVAPGDATPLGGTFDLGPGSLEARGARVFFVSSVSGGSVEEALFEADVVRHTVRALVKRGDAVRGHGRITAFGPVAVTRKGLAFIAGLDNVATALLVLQRGGPAPVVVTGDVVGGTGRRTLAAIDGLVPRGDAFLIGGALSGVDGPRGLFVARGRRASKLFVDGEVVAGSGTVTESDPIAFGARGAIFLGSFAATADDVARRAVFQRGRRSTRRLVAVGDPVLGGAVTDIGAAATSGSAAIVTVGLDAGAPARGALLRVGR